MGALVAWLGVALAWDGIGSTWNEMPVRYGVSQDLDGLDEIATLEAIDRAFAAWDEVACADVSFEYVGRTEAAFGAADDENIVSFLGEAWPDDPSRRTTEVLTLAGDRIREADVALRTDGVVWVLDEADGTATLDLQAGVTHAVGRLLGLGDSSDPAATMSPAAVGDPEGRSLSDDDIEGLCALYPAEGAVPLGGSCETSADCAEPYQCVADALVRYCAPECPRGLCPADYLCSERTDPPVCTRAGCGCATGGAPGAGLLALGATLLVRVLATSGRNGRAPRRLGSGQSRKAGRGRKKEGCV